MPFSLDACISQLTEAEILSNEELRGVLDECAAEQRPLDGEQLTTLLVRPEKLTAYQARVVRAGRAKGLVMGNYLIRDRLGQGGMGVVYLAEHRRMSRIVALKVLSRKVGGDSKLVARFQREVKAVARLSHPNIVCAYDADEARGTHFLAMEYAQGMDLEQLVKRDGPLPVDRAIDCVLQAARGLEYAHQHGIVHRDIKPANLLLDIEGTVRILDLGLARFDQGQLDELTSTGSVMGTIDYMSPEQAADAKHADAHADVYSLGMTLWFLLTGRPAYDGDTLMVKLLAHRQAPIPSLVESCPDVSPSLDSVFQKMVAKSVEERYARMTDVITDLAACRTELDRLCDTVPGDVPLTEIGEDEQTLLSHPPLDSSIPADGRNDDRRVNGKSTSLQDSGAQDDRRKRNVRFALLAAVGVIGLTCGAFFAIRMLTGDGKNADEAFVAEVDPSGGASSTGGPRPPALGAGYALFFDGRRSRVEIPSFKYDGTHPLTLEATALARGTEMPGLGYVIADVEKGGLGILLGRDGNWRWDANALDEPERTVDIQAEVDYQPVHLALVYDHPAIRLYVNGRLTSAATATRQYQPARAYFVVGAQPHSKDPVDFFAGVIDEVRISRVARYNEDFTPASSFVADTDTLALYHFDEGQGDVANDDSGNGHQGEIVQATWAREAPSDRRSTQLVVRSRIQGRAFHDLDADGQWSDNEPGLPGRTVILDQNRNGKLDGTERLAETDPDGLYCFNDLQCGDYWVTELARSGWRPTFRESRLILEQVVPGNVPGEAAHSHLSYVALSPDERHVYANAYKSRELLVFRRDPDNGHLSLLQTCRDGAGGFGGLDGVTAIAATTDGKHVYATARNDGAIAALQREQATGRLHPIQVFKARDEGIDGPSNLVSPTVSPDGKRLYVAGRMDSSLAAFERDATNGRLTFLETIRQKTNQGTWGVDLIAVSPDGRNIYATSYRSNALVQFERDVDSGRIEPVAIIRDNIDGVDGLQDATAVGSPADGKQVYVTSRYDHSLAVFQRDPATGQLDFTQFFRDEQDGLDSLRESVSLVISPDDQFVYVASRGDYTINVFRRDPKDGRLTFVEAVKHKGIPFPCQVDSLAVGPSGRYVFATSLDANILAVFRHWPSDGPLELVAAARDGLAGVHGLQSPECVALSPDGGDVYIAGYTEGSVTRFRWEEETETLSFVGCIHNGDDHDGRQVQGLNRIYSLTVSCDGENVYTMSCGDDAVSAFQRDTTSGELKFIETRSSRLTPGSGVSNAECGTLSPDGRFLYTVATWDSSIAVFRRAPVSAE